ncbi:MAG: hypothetical protein MUC31_09345 [Bacteroidales bacterium]|nr:hypothetical protein [Bacteroidales bacterium]
MPRKSRSHPEPRLPHCDLKHLPVAVRGRVGSDEVPEDRYQAEEYNEKEPGKGDTWQEAWTGDRVARFQPRFEEAFNNFFVFTALNFRINPDAGGTHKMVVHTSFTEPGFNIYMTSKNASINAEVTFFDASNTELAKVLITNSPGSGIFELDYDTGVRIQEAYANAGRSLAALVAEKVYGK